MDVHFRMLEPARVVVWRYTGPYGGLARVVREATAWLREHKEPGGAVTTVFLDPDSLDASRGRGAGAHGHEHGVGHDPHSAGSGHEEEGHLVAGEVWVAVSDRLTVAAGPPELRVVPAVHAAVLERAGDPRELLPIALALRAFLEREGHRIAPETRIVHEMPAWDALDEWRAQVHLPLIK